MSYIGLLVKWIVYLIMAVLIYLWIKKVWHKYKNGGARIKQAETKTTEVIKNGDNNKEL